MSRRWSTSEELKFCFQDEIKLRRRNRSWCFHFHSWSLETGLFALEKFSLNHVFFCDKEFTKVYFSLDVPENNIADIVGVSFSTDKNNFAYGKYELNFVFQFCFLLYELTRWILNARWNRRGVDNSICKQTHVCIAVDMNSMRATEINK